VEAARGGRRGTTRAPRAAAVIWAWVAFFERPTTATSVGGGPIGESAVWSSTGAFPVTLDAAVDVYGNVMSVTDPTPGSYTGFRETVRYGAPWTTGKVTLRYYEVGYGMRVRYLEGSDARVDGIGSISLVSGCLSRSTTFGGLAQRHWMSFDMSQFTSVPSVSAGGLVLLAALFAGSTFWVLRRGVRGR